MTRRGDLEREASAALDEQDAARELLARGVLRWTADDVDCPDVMRLAALAEELGEVARCVHDGDAENLPRELHQLAGVAIAWAHAAGVQRSQLTLLD